MFDDVDRNRAHLPATRERTPSSRVLEDLLRQAPPDQFTLGWVLSTLHRHPVSWGSRDRTHRIVGPRDYAHSRGSPNDRGDSRTHLPAIHH